jgi:hypothetical protein
MKKALVLSAIFFLASFTAGSAFLLRAQAYVSADAIDTIRSRYAEINKNLSRYRKVKKELSGYSAEGGQLEAYFDGKAIRKIVATHYGESGRATEEFYYWDDQLIFVFRKDSQYDKPLSGKVVSTSENRFYFDNKQLIRWIGENGKQVSSNQPEYAEKQRENLENSSEFLKLVR